MNKDNQVDIDGLLSKKVTDMMKEKSSKSFNRQSDFLNLQPMQSNSRDTNTYVNFEDMESVFEEPGFDGCINEGNSDRRKNTGKSMIVLTEKRENPFRQLSCGDKLCRLVPHSSISLFPFYFRDEGMYGHPWTRAISFCCGFLYILIIVSQALYIGTIQQFSEHKVTFQSNHNLSGIYLNVHPQIINSESSPRYMPIYEIVGAEADFCEVYNLFDYEQQKEIGYYEMQFAH